MVFFLFGIISYWVKRQLISNLSFNIFIVLFLFNIVRGELFLASDISNLNPFYLHWVCYICWIFRKVTFNIWFQWEIKTWTYWIFKSKLFNIFAFETFFFLISTIVNFSLNKNFSNLKLDHTLLYLNHSSTFVSFLRTFISISFSHNIHFWLMLSWFDVYSIWNEFDIPIDIHILPIFQV